MARGISRWRVAVVAGLVVCSISVFSAEASPAATAKSPIKIALISELSGPQPAVIPVGQAVQAGMSTAVYLANKAGGVNGHLLQVKTYDAGLTAGTTAQALRQAVSDGNSYIVGFMTNADLLPSIAFVKAAKIPTLLANPLFSDINLPFIFSSTVSTATTSQLSVESMKKLLGGSLVGKTFAMEGVTPASAVDEKMVGIKAAVKKAGGRVTLTLRDAISLTSYSSQAANVMAAGVDGFFTVHQDAAVLVMAKALGVAGFKGPILSDMSANSDPLFAGVNLPNFYALRDGLAPFPGTALYNAIREAKASTLRALASPTYFNSTYTNVWNLVRGLQKCGIPCPQAKLTTAMRSLGNISIPLNPYFGPPNFSKSQSGGVSAQVWHYDSVAKKTKPFSPVISL